MGLCLSGRIMAARKFGADATGVEMDEDLVKQSSAKIKGLGLKKARIVRGDLMLQAARRQRRRQHQHDGDAKGVRRAPAQRPQVAASLQFQHKRCRRGRGED